MRYIRTKDERIIDCGISKQEYEIKCPSSNVSYERWFELVFESEYEIIKQADTIDELCDEFVVVSKSFLRPWKITRKWFDTLSEIEKEYPNEKCSIYGAIWTDKGLIYVAKMNDKGELELL